MRLRLLSMLVVAACSLGCSSGGDSMTDPAVDCSLLDADGCALEAQCSVIAAVPLERLANGDWCRDDAAGLVPLGCEPAGLALPAIVTWASPAGDPDTCLELGGPWRVDGNWQDCEGDPSAARPCP